VLQRQLSEWVVAAFAVAEAGSAAFIDEHADQDVSTAAIAAAARVTVRAHHDRWWVKPGRRVCDRSRRADGVLPIRTLRRAGSQGE